jgi:serine phosphatase RsbU (regulator of sigma subunit)/CBS domain-containing protein
MSSPSQYSAELLKDVMRPVETLPSITTVTEVASIFTANAALLMIPVSGDAGFEGVISRRDLFSRHLARKFAAELFGNKPINLLINPQPITMSPDMDINAALSLLLELDPELDNDSFPVLDEGNCVGIVHVAELIMVISKAQASLLNKLEILSARIREEVDKARQIQQDLLPPSSCRFAGTVLDAVLINSSEISGDVYDYYAIDDHRLVVMVGDVSGHGVQSGMVATAAKAGLHLLLDRGIRTPSELLTGMNKAVLVTASSSLMMTALIAVIDLDERKISYANAGHNYPYLFRDSSSSLIKLDNTGGFPLGFDSGSVYDEAVVDFHHNDRLLLYTDGIVEACNRDNEEFGYDRLETFLQEKLSNHPATVRQELVETVLVFSGADGFEDDVTILIIGDENEES